MDSKTATIAGSIIIGAALIAGAIFFGGQRAAPEGPTFKPEALRPATPTDHHLGPIDSPVKLFVFTDLECPFCKKFHETVLELSAAYPNLAIIYRNFPLENLHTKAKTEAEAAECAGKVGGEEAYWTMVNKIFEVTPSNDGLDLDLLPGIASEAGVDSTAFTNCLKSNATKDRVERDLREANETGGSGTPWSILITPKGNKIPIVGARDFAIMSGAIEEAFKEVK